MSKSVKNWFLTGKRFFFKKIPSAPLSAMDGLGRDALLTAAVSGNFQAAIYFYELGSYREV